MKERVLKFELQKHANLKGSVSFAYVPSPSVNSQQLVVQNREEKNRASLETRSLKIFQDPRIA
jgi:hypothetical protein